MNQLEQVSKKVDNLAVAEERELFTDKNDEIDTRKAVWNITDDELAEVVSDHYTIVQHQDFFGKVIPSIRKIDKDIMEVKMKDHREAVYLEVVFDTYFHEDEAILAGIRAGNSFDKTCRAFVEVYALREICTNGMMGRALFGRAGRLHVGGIKTDDLIERIEDKMPEARDNLANVITEAKNDKIKGVHVEAILQEMNFGKKHADYVAKEVNKTKVSRWKVYNKVTEYIENEIERVELGRENLHAKANKILSRNSDTLEKLVKESE